MERLPDGASGDRDVSASMKENSRRCVITYRISSAAFARDVVSKRLSSDDSLPAPSGDRRPSSMLGREWGVCGAEGGVRSTWCTASPRVKVQG